MDVGLGEKGGAPKWTCSERMEADGMGRKLGRKEGRKARVVRCDKYLRSRGVMLMFTKFIQTRFLFGQCSARNILEI